MQYNIYPGDGGRQVPRLALPDGRLYHHRYLFYKLVLPIYTPVLHQLCSACARELRLHNERRLKKK